LLACLEPGGPGLAGLPAGLLARLGLRAGEVADLELGDLDWRAGEI
jgi:integrase